MTELDQFIDFNKTKAVKTIETYKRMYKKISEILGGNVSHFSQDKIIELVNDKVENINTTQALLNVALLIRKMLGMSTNILQAERKKNIEKVITHTKKINEEKKEILPSLQELNEYTDYLYENKLYSDYIINYLILNFFVRNEDLNFLLKLKKKDTIDSDFNYLWFDKRNKKVVFIRNNYKTASTYGQKKHTIIDPKFFIAVKNLVAERKDIDNDKFIVNDDGIGYHIMKSTFNGIGEGNYIKVIINDNLKKNNTDILKQISQSRGTDIQTLINNYTL